MGYGHVSLIYNDTGQTLNFYPPAAELILEGLPTSAATYSVWAGTQADGDTAKFTGTATLDSVSTTVDVASGYGQTNRRKLSLAATTNISIGEKYVVSNTAGQRELVVVQNIVSADYVEVEEDLSYDYAITSSTFKGIKHYFTVDATFIATESNINIYGSSSSTNFLQSNVPFNGPAAPPYRIRWTYTTSAQRRAWTTFDVVRRPLKHNVSIQSLRPLFPDVVWNEWITQRGQDYRPQIDAAFELVKFDIRMAGYDSDQITDPEIVDELTRHRALVVIGEAFLAMGGGDTTWLERVSERYKSMFEKSIGTGLRAWIDTGSSGSISISPPRQLFLRGR